MKKILLFLASALLLMGSTGCQRNLEPAEPSEPEPPAEVREMAAEELTVEFAPVGGDPVEQLQRLRQVATALKEALAEQGVQVETVRATLGASAAATAQAVAQGGVDAAFLQAEDLIAFGPDALPLSTAAWPALSCDSQDPADWNAEASTWTETQAAGCRVLLLAGPSDYGRQLAQRWSDSGKLTWEELSRATWGRSDSRMENMLSLWLADRYEGKTLEDLPKTEAYASEDRLLSALAAERVDVAVIAADSRIDAAGDWEQDTGGSIWEETVVIGVSDRFYGVTVAAAPESLWTQDAYAQALQAAVAALAEEEDPALTALAALGPCRLTEAEDLSGMEPLAALHS